MSTQYQNFRNQDLTGTDFSGQDLTGCNFREANLTDCNFQDSILHYANFMNANVDGATFNGGTKARFSAWLINVPQSNPNKAALNLDKAVGLDTVDSITEPQLEEDII